MNIEQELPEILHTKNWIQNVVIGLNFCPFAAKEFKQNTIRYKVIPQENIEHFKKELLEELELLENEPTIATTLLIFPNQFKLFTSFVKFINDGENIVARSNFFEDYQLASFHPDYLFAGEPTDAPTHYTNRSPYPMLHILREDMVSDAIDKYPYEMDKIPNDNIEFTNSKGIAYMKELFKKSFE